jgi:two-component system chemotaxis response regulator CheY
MVKTETKNILVVDYEGTGRKLLAGRLQLMDFATVEAGTPEEVQKALASQTFNLVISDLKIPSLELKELFQKYKTLKCPLLVFSDRVPGEETDDWKIAQVKGVYHKSQRAELLKKVLELTGWGAGRDLREGPETKNILLIEDSPTIRNMIRRILQKNFPDCLIREAADGREALSEMSNKKVDLIITDLQMPGMDGQTFLKILHKNPLLKTKPVVVLSSSISSQLREDLKGYESVRLLAKPSSAEEISETVSALMSGKAIG